MLMAAAALLLLDWITILQFLTCKIEVITVYLSWAVMKVIVESSTDWLDWPFLHLQVPESHMSAVLLSSYSTSLSVP